MALEIAAAHVLRYRFKGEIRFLFIESDRQKARFLDDLCRRTFPELPPNITYRVIADAFETVISQILDTLEAQRAKLAPTFVFIDPFGIKGIPLHVIAGIMNHRCCEVLINFMYDTANRWALTHAEYMDSLFGTGAWRAIETISDPEERRIFLSDLYFSQLASAAGVTYIRAFEIRDRNNRTKYYLVFGTNNLKGLREMKNAMWKVDPEGLFRFSAHRAGRSAEQISLFQMDDINQQMLADLLSARFSGMRKRIEDVDEFVIAETPYLERHVRPALKLLEGSMPRARARVLATPGRQRRKGTFPAGTLIQFM